MAGDRLVDIGPHYLPREASQPSEPMPPVAWDLTEPIPPFLRYWSREDLGLRTVLVSDLEIEARMASFVALCERKSRAQVSQPKLPHWLLKYAPSFLERRESGDRWVQYAMRFAIMRDAVAHLPF